MRTRNVLTVAAIALLAAGTTGCSDDSGGIDVADFRELATEAGDSPDDCPLDVDVSEALGGDDAEFVSAEAGASESEEPADDPVEAQLEDGLSPLDAAAASEIACTFSIDGEELEIRVVAMPAGRATNLYLPLVANTADLPITELEAFSHDIPDAGNVAVAGDLVALGELEVDGDGGAAIFVTGGGLTGDDLEAAATELGDQITD